MSSTEITPFDGALTPASKPALGVIRHLRKAGHEALLAGGCVRDLLLGEQPKDYDVATDARPERVIELFPSTRKVGAQFGVVLVKHRKEWLEVATFRSDGEYIDGRRPSTVSFGDARADALRRDFTINGMFLDPIAREVRDYVGGRADLEAGLIRAIGNAAERFAEDYLRLLRAVRFAARLDFAFEDETKAAISKYADKLPQVAAERRREELSKMLAHPRQSLAFELLRSTGLLNQLWDGAMWSESHCDHVAKVLPRDTHFSDWVLVFAIMLSDREPSEAGEIARGLACSNEERRTIEWLIAKQDALQSPAELSLAELKRLMAAPDFHNLLLWQLSRHISQSDTQHHAAVLLRRYEDLLIGSVAPPPLVTGHDLQALGVEPGPVFKRVLDAVYTAQLNETLGGREEALEFAQRLLAEECKNE